MRIPGQEETILLDAKNAIVYDESYSQGLKYLSNEARLDIPVKHFNLWKSIKERKISFLVHA